MPYFVYQLSPPQPPTYLATYPGYQEARERVRALRQADPAAGAAAYRLIFAAQQAEAERLLSLPRDERVIGED